MGSASCPALLASVHPTSSLPAALSTEFLSSVSASRAQSTYHPGSGPWLAEQAPLSLNQAGCLSPTLQTAAFRLAEPEGSEPSTPTSAVQRPTESQELGQAWEKGGNIACQESALKGGGGQEEPAFSPSCSHSQLLIQENQLPVQAEKSPGGAFCTLSRSTASRMVWAS